jgi:hypothetical protein
VRSRDDATHYTYYAYIYYGYNDIPLGEIYTKYHNALNGYQMNLDVFQIHRVPGGSDIKVKLTTRLTQTISGVGTYELNHRICGPSAALAGSVSNCPYSYYESGDGRYGMANTFGWTNVSQPNPSAADGYW